MKISYFYAEVEKVTKPKENLNSEYSWRHQFFAHDTYGRAMCIYSHVVIVVMSYVDLLNDVSYWSLVIKAFNDEMSTGAQAKHLLQVIIDR